MTRFARASGSKASNQRTSEDSTPWSQLKQQLIQSKQEFEQQDSKKEETNWKSVLEIEKKIEENKKSVWCAFDDEKSKDQVKQTADRNSPQELTKSKGKKRKSVLENSIPDESDPINLKLPNKKLKQSNLKHLQSQLKLSPNETYLLSEKGPELTKQHDSVNTNLAISSKPKKKKENKNRHVSSSGIDVENGNLVKNQDSSHEEKTENKSSHIRQNSDNENAELVNCHDGSDLIKGVKDQKDIKKHNTITWKKNNVKQQNSQGYKRRKCDEGDTKLEINGQEIWVTRLDGFYIKKEDAERIKQLEIDLLKRGISKQEVRAAIKKERRNAEKSLARQKKKVCYHCRKGGHTLSSCPKLDTNGTPVIGSGMCYKCGSTEHTHFQCKVVSGNSFKFATCFICKQEGHISKQCPDNPRGMYPTGGGCRLCGDVTHFRRECPTLQKKSNKVTAGLMDQDVEKLGDDVDVLVSKNLINKRQNKIVKFS